MIVLAGADIVLSDRIVSGGSLVLHGATIAAIDARARVDPAAAQIIDATGCYIVPGFIDVHVHGVAGLDGFDGPDAVAGIAARLPRYGVTAFCPASVACPPDDLRGFLAQVRRARTAPERDAARVLSAHLESNFISPAFAGAQPVECLRSPADLDVRGPGPTRDGSSFSARDILAVIAEHRADVGIVTLAPELPGGLDLVRTLAAAGHRVALGHSGADFETAIAAIEAGARHATHLFNRMPPMHHRAPGLAGAVLAREDVAAELICDGYHVHPAMCRMTMAAKGAGGVMAITDGTAGAGLAIGSLARLGTKTIRVGPHAAELEGGALAGGTLTMDRAFANIVSRFGGSLVDAAAMCATTPARELGLTGCGVIAEGALADVVMLDRRLQVVRTFVGGVPAYAAGLAVQ